MNDRAGHLIALADAIQRGEPPAPEVRDWLTRGVRGWLAGVPIEQALGLRADVASFHRRDEALRAAGHLLGDDPAALSESIRRFQSARTREPTKVDRHLDEALQAGRPLPTSPKHLRRILRGTRTDKHTA